MNRAMMAPALAVLVLAGAPSLSPVPPQARPLPLWLGTIDCYVPGPEIGRAQRQTGNFDAYSAESAAENDQACLRLNEMLMRLRRGR